MKPKLSLIPARRCLTATAFCIYKAKILLIKHRKLGIWLAPGGHLEPNEVPHQTAVRELFEETGVKGEIISAYPTFEASSSENLPLPFSINLHWINKGKCEQHLAFNYLVKTLGNHKLVCNPEEVDDFGWFSVPMLENLLITKDIKTEIKCAFNLLVGV